MPNGKPGDVVPDDPPIRRATTVAAPVERAFAAFVERMGAWWPREYTWSEDALSAVVVEPRQGGRWYERAGDGREAEWGRVLAWEPPRHVVLTWQIRPDRAPEPDPAKASEVDVRFTPDGAASTRVEVEHRAFARHGEGAKAYRAGMDSEAGWPRLLALYAAWVASAKEGGGE